MVLLPERTRAALGIIELKMQTLLVALLAAVVGAVFLIARRGYWGYAASFR